VWFARGLDWRWTAAGVVFPAFLIGKFKLFTSMV
jgi:hypothetical protein